MLWKPYITTDFKKEANYDCAYFYYFFIVDKPCRYAKWVAKTVSYSTIQASYWKQKNQIFLDPICIFKLLKKYKSGKIKATETFIYDGGKKKIRKYFLYVSWHSHTNF